VFKTEPNFGNLTKDSNEKIKVIHYKNFSAKAAHSINNFLSFQLSFFFKERGCVLK
jgi:hypothetical protein